MYNLVWSGPIWSDLFQSGPVWSSLVQSGPIWSNMVQSGPIWSNLVRSGPIWSDLVQSGPIWFNLFQSGPIWSNLVQSGLCIKRPTEIKDPLNYQKILENQKTYWQKAIPRTARASSWSKTCLPTYCSFLENCSSKFLEDCQSNNWI